VSRATGSSGRTCARWAAACSDQIRTRPAASLFTAPHNPFLPTIHTIMHTRPFTRVSTGMIHTPPFTPCTPLFTPLPSHVCPQVGLVIIDEIHLLGEDRGPILEVIVSRMRYIATKTGQAVRPIAPHPSHTPWDPTSACATLPPRPDRP
jgi:hypothetical protein